MRGAPGAGREALKGIAQFSGKQRQWSLKREVAKRSTTSPGSFTVPCDHAIEFLDLGKVVFLFIKLKYIDMFIPCVFPWRAVNRLMKRGWGQRGTLAVGDVEHFLHGQQGEKGW